MTRKRKKQKTKTKKVEKDLNLKSLEEKLQEGLNYAKNLGWKISDEKFFNFEQKTCCLIGSLLLKELGVIACEKRTIELEEGYQEGYECQDNYYFHLAAQTLKIKKNQLSHIILGFDESFEFKKKRKSNHGKEYYDLGFDFGKQIQKI